MKRCYIDIQKLGFNPNFHAILQIVGIIEVDNNILDTFTIKCKPFFYDQSMVGRVLQDGVCLENVVTSDEYLQPKDSLKIFKAHLDKYIDLKDETDKYQFVEFSDVEFTFKFLNSFFEKNKDTSFQKYFWNPPLDLQYVSEFILEFDRFKFTNFNLATVAGYFGFKVEKDKIKDPFYRVTLIRNLYHILDKFRTLKVYVKRAQLN